MVAEALAWTVATTHSAKRFRAELSIFPEVTAAKAVLRWSPRQLPVPEPAPSQAGWWSGTRRNLLL